MSEYDVRYPLLQKYDAPVISGVIRNEDLEVWLRTLPDDWNERFIRVYDPVSIPITEVYAGEAEEVLAFLEKQLQEGV